MTPSHFEALKKLWKQDTLILSDTHKICSHPCYQAIILDGWGAMPWIMRDLRDNGPDHWFWALVTIVGKDVAKGETTMQGATDKWVAWGEVVGLFNEIKPLEVWPSD